MRELISKPDFAKDGLRELSMTEIDQVAGGRFSASHVFGGAATMFGGGMMGYGAAVAVGVGLGTVGVAALGVGAAVAVGYGAFEIATHV